LKKQKTISLDEKTAAIAETIPNFSEWVRANLLRWDENDEDEPVYKYWMKCDKNPEHVWMTFSRDRYAKYDGHSCIACLRDLSWGDKEGKVWLSKTVVENED
jgi:hypothetical protein